MTNEVEVIQNCLAELEKVKQRMEPAHGVVYLNFCSVVKKLRLVEQQMVSGVGPRDYKTFAGKERLY